LSVVFLLLVTVFTAAGLGADPVPDSSFPRLRPCLEWKYAWNDGGLANLIGSAKAWDFRPLGVTNLPSGGYSPSDIRRAYGYDRLHALGGTGSNSTIAIVVAFGCPTNTLQTDLDKFCTDFGIPSLTPEVVFPVGEPGEVDSGWAGETMMDVEWSHALAPDARLLVVVSKDDSVSNLAACVEYASTNSDVVVMSWGGPEDSTDPLNHHLFTNTSVSFVASSGDNGKGEINWPAADPMVLATGGTSLISDGTNILSETAWGASSGGISLYQAFPAYQAGWTSANGGRHIPDVSLLADPYTGVYVYNTDPLNGRGGWSVNGGTSLACPMWGALLACRSSLGISPKGFLHPLLYGSAAIPGKSNLYEISSPVFRDITRYPPHARGTPFRAFPPTRGYDLVTGLGSPVSEGIVSLTPSSTSPVSVSFQEITPVTYSPGRRIGLIAGSSRGNLQITFTSSKPGVAAVSGTSLLIRGAGTSTITATIPGRSIEPVSRILVVDKAPVSLSASNPSTVPYKKNGILPFRAISSPAFPIQYTSDQTNVLSFSGSKALIRGMGTARVTVSVPGNSNYQGTNVVREITVTGNP
jgi:subtilase family serine protease